MKHSPHSSSAPLLARRIFIKAVALAALALPALPACASLFDLPSTVSATLSMGTTHGCSLAGTGVATCWGSLPMAPLAYGLRADDIRVGDDFSCALTNVSVQCWGGSNAYSQLGRPVLQAPWGYTLSGLRQISQIAVGARHGCARTVELQVFCWGDGRQGQIGSAVSATTAEAVRVEGMSEILKLATGRASTCGVMDALSNGRRVICVGAGSGLAGAVEDPRTARAVPGITDAVDISLFAGHACVLRGFGKVSCWGSNQHGELGVPASSGPLTTPVEVPDLGAPAKAVAVGDGFTCALLEGGSIKCWGNNANGQLGMGLAPGAATPATGQVTGISNAIAISAGKTAACAVLQGGYVQCWGEGAGWSSAPCRVPSGVYPGVPASYGPAVDIAICRPQGSAAPMAVHGLGPANDAAQVLEWAEKTLPQTFAPQAGTVPAGIDKDLLYVRDYPGGHRLAINAHGTPQLLYAGPLSAGQVANLGPLSQWIREAALHEGLNSGLQLQATTRTDFPLAPCAVLYTTYGIRGGTSALPEGLMSNSAQVAVGGRSVEHTAGGGVSKTALINDIQWIADGTLVPGPGARLEPVHLGSTRGCSTLVDLKSEVEVTVFYTIGKRKGALRTRAQMTTSS